MFINRTSARGPPQCAAKNRTVEAIKWKCIGNIEHGPICERKEP